ncbi:MAG: hypothetical protein M1818_006519 [Claussenomyces sp. TS43310]|nr:MAG: hypothetical protein M1818_006519 [Claussenomyces sp. TS43310]
MADDSMEISSEFGQNIEGDDIDIDIDLTTDDNGPHDEDRILEDVKSDIGYDETNDDIMIDEDHASLPMDDVELASDVDTQENDQDNPITSEITELGAVAVELDDVLDTDITNEPSRAEGLSSITWHPSRDADTSIEEVAEEQELAENVEGDRLDVEDDVPAQLELQSTDDSRPEEAVVDVDSKGNEFVTTDDDANPSSSGDFRVDDGVKTAIKEENITSSANRVIVLYQDAEYSLISISPSDDPDSFFFKDDALIKESLPSFIEGLREVILDELSPDDELCLVIDDLGIEIRETSASIFDVTFAQIMALYEDLLRNDSVDLPGPLHISLSVKPNHLSRLRILRSGVEEGKGLSQIVPWEEQSEAFDEESEEIDEAPINTDVNGSDKETVDIVEPIESKDDVDLVSDELISAPGAQGRQEISEFEEIAEDNDNSELPHDNEKSGATATEDNSTTLAQPEYVEEQVTEEEDNENDLIDYGDEEPDQTAPILNNGNDIKTAEDEAANEELRRPTLSNTFDRDDESTSQHTQDAVPNVESETIFTEDSVVEDQEHHYSEDDNQQNGEDHDDGQTSQQNDRQEAPAISLDTDAKSEVQAEHAPMLENQSLESEHHAAPIQPDPTRHEDPDEIDYEIRASDTEEYQSSVAKQHYIQVEAAVTDGEVNANTDEISYEDEPIQGSNGSESTLVGDDTRQDARNCADTDFNDEIDYDDDDIVEKAELPELATLAKISPLPSGQSGKRSHDELDDVAGGDAKGQLTYPLEQALRCGVTAF